MEQCRAAVIPCFLKQLGAVPVTDEAQWRNGPALRLLNAHNRNRALPGTVPIKFYDRKGGDMSEWPPDLRVRQFPEVRR